MSIGVFEVLVAARGRIRKGWTQGAYARATDNSPVGPEDPDAVCWCSSGALLAASLALHAASGIFWKACDELRSEIDRTQVSRWNDEPERSHDNVLAAFDRAITSVLDERAQ